MGLPQCQLPRKRSSVRKKASHAGGAPVEFLPPFPKNLQIKVT